MRFLIATSLLISACGSPEKDARILELEGQVKSLSKQKAEQEEIVSRLKTNTDSCALEQSRLKEEIKTEQAKIKVLVEPIEKRHDKCDIECKQKYAKCLVNGFPPTCDLNLEGCEQRCMTLRDLEKHNIPFACVYQ